MRWRIFFSNKMYFFFMRNMRELNGGRLCTMKFIGRVLRGRIAHFFLFDQNIILSDMARRQPCSNVSCDMSNATIKSKRSNELQLQISCSILFQNVDMKMSTLSILKGYCIALCIYRSLIRWWSQGRIQRETFI